MSEVPPQYEALLKTYQTQQKILDEKRKALNEVKLEYSKVMELSQQEAKELDKSKQILNKKKAILDKELTEILNICQENEISNKETKTIVDTVDKSFNKISGITDHNIKTVQDVAKELKQMDEDLQLSNVRAQVLEYKRKEEIAKDYLVENAKEFKRICGINPRLSEFEIDHQASFWPQADPNRLKDLNDELVKIRNNIEVMENQIKQYQQSDL